MEEKVAIALYKLKSCSEYQVVGNIFGFSKSTVHNIFHKVVELIIKQLTREFIKFPNAREAEVIAKAFEKKTKIPTIMGAIDGSYIPVKVESEGHKDFLCRKGFTAIALQAVVDNNGL